MSILTPIQWCDSTLNFIMGCFGCELFPKPKIVLEAIDRLLICQKIDGWNPGQARQLYKRLLFVAWQQLLDAIEKPGLGHRKLMTLTNIWHLRKRFENLVAADHGIVAGELARSVVERRMKCYAALLHLNKSYSIVNPTRQPNSGYAGTFEQVTRFEGRTRKAAGFADLLGKDRPMQPWLNGLPRLVFISDMGDALSRKGDFDFVKNEMKEVQTEEGMKHLWLWLSKRPENMQELADSIGGMPDNVCAMTTVTSLDTLDRVDELREVNAPVRGLSVEPLWSNIADELDLTGIDWLIVGGESGAKASAEVFDTRWAEDLHALCRQHGVALFNKQLGSLPMRDGVEFDLKDSHGGDWLEWDEPLRVREFPTYFHEYRANERSSTGSAVQPGSTRR